MLSEEPDNKCPNTCRPNSDTYSGETCSSTSKHFVSEKQTYYFSKFELFQEKNTRKKSTYGKYKSFLAKLASQLGVDWDIEAKLLFASSPTRQLFFETCLSVWLEINKMQIAKTIKEEDPNVNYENMYFEIFYDKLSKKLLSNLQSRQQHSSSVKMGSVSQAQGEDDDEFDMDQLRQLAMGFFFSANQLWDMLFSKKNINNNNKSTDMEVEEERGKSKSIFSPLMVASQRIFTLFTNKKIKTEEPQPIRSSHTLQKQGSNTFSQFKENLQDEEQIQCRMRRLTLGEHNNIKEEDGQSITKSESEVVIERIPENNPINPSLLEQAYSYIQNIMGSKNSWQVARGFVTSILEINYNKVEEGMGIKAQEEIECKSTPQVKIQEDVADRRSSASSGSKREISVRVLKPANDFYHNLMVVWLLFKNNAGYKMRFREYLDKVKTSLGTSWKQNYLEPTKLFFTNLNQEWNELSSDKESIYKQDEEVIEIFVERVKQTMEKEWDSSIVKKQGEFSQRLVSRASQPPTTTNL